MNRLLASQMRISWSVLLANKIGEEFTQHRHSLVGGAEECKALDEISQGTTLYEGYKATILGLHDD